MEVNENVINNYKEDIKKLIEALDIIDLTIKDDDENKINEGLISDDELETKLNELLYTFKRVYPNIDGDATRLKLMGNVHITDEHGMVKSKSYQIYGLVKRERVAIQKAHEEAESQFRESLVPWKKLQEKYKKIAELCYKLEQIKLYEKIKEIEARVNHIDNDENFERQELEKFFIKKTRKRKTFF